MIPHPETVQRLRETNWRDYARKLRIDASGEDGRMDSGDMYRLADLLIELDALLSSQNMTGGVC